MTSIERHPSPPPSPRFQFTLRTLLLLFVVLGSSLAVFGAWGIVVFGLVVGLAIGIHRAKSLSSPAFIIFAAFCLICFLVVLLMPFLSVAREQGRRTACRYHLRNVALALLAYQDNNGHFPPAYIADKSGKPMHSWRTLLLPYMEYDALYKTYDLTQPWDAPANKSLSFTPMREYECPSDSNSRKPGPERTSYLAIVGPDTAWAGDKARKLADFGRDPPDTILLIEVFLSGITWTEPRDLSVDMLKRDDTEWPLIAPIHQGGQPDTFFFKYEHGAGAHVAMADGSVRFLRTDNLSVDDLRQILQIGGCKEGTIGSRALLNDSAWHPNWPNIAALAVWLLSVGTLLTKAVRSRKPQAVSPIMSAG